MNPHNRVQSWLFGSNFRSNDLATLTLENFERVMAESLYKAIDSPTRCPVKEKHIRALLIGCHQAQSASFFWKHLLVVRLKEEMLVCWKFCYVLHKILRDGPRKVVDSCNRAKMMLIDVGNMWRYVNDPYAKLNHRYCSLLFNRIQLLVRNPQFPNDLKLDEEMLDKVPVDTMFEFTCETMDAVEDVCKLVTRALDTFEKQQLSSSTNAGKCLLAPLIACVQDASLLYECCCKILYKLHNASGIDEVSLDGHRRRFDQIHDDFYWCYKRTRDLHYFRTLLQIPHVDPKPPHFNWLSDSGSNQRHRDATRITVIAQASNDTLVDLDGDENDDDSIGAVNQTHNDTAPTPSSSLEQQQQQTDQANQEETNKKPSREALIKDSEMSEALIIQAQEAAKAAQEELAEYVRQTSKAAEEVEAQMKLERDEFERKMIELQDSLTGCTTQLDAEREQKLALEKEFNSKIKAVQDELKQVKSQLAIAEQKYEKAQLDNEISSRAMRKMAEEMNQLKRETENRQSKLLIAEMDETDKIIEIAAKRIEALSELSRKQESGVKLQVNEKISEVCTNLMKAVRQLIIRSDALQREVVSSQGEAVQEEFYKRNSSWTEGLISAAKNVAIGAKSLVDAADRAMSGEGKYSELIAAAHEIAAATTLLVVASRVKANQDSEKLRLLTSVAKQVNQCKGNIVDTARVCADLLAKDLESELDISTLSLHQTKKLEMEAQVKLLELEAALSKERIRLGILRRRHYEQEEAQLDLLG